MRFRQFPLTKETDKLYFIVWSNRFPIGTTKKYDGGWSWEKDSNKTPFKLELIV